MPPSCLSIAPAFRWVVIALWLLLSPKGWACDQCAQLEALASLKSLANPKDGLAWTTGEKSLAIIRVDFSDLEGTPRDDAGVFSRARLLDVVNGWVDGYFRAASYGRAGVALTDSGISDVLRLPKPAGAYVSQRLLEDLRNDALKTAEQAGFDHASHDRVLILMSSVEELPGSTVEYRGFSWIGTAHLWFQGDFSPALVGHELGHSHGLGHASLWEVARGSSDPFDPMGRRDEYGNEFDLMGGIRYDPAYRNRIGVPSLLDLGWLDSEAVQLVSNNGVYRVHAFDQSTVPSGATFGLRVAIDDQRSYWLSLRDRYDSLQGGILVERHDTSTNTTLLYDMVPGGGLDDAALKPGQVLEERELGMQVRVNETGVDAAGAWADVEVRFLPEIAFRKADLSVLESAGEVEVILDRMRNVGGRIEVHWETVPDSAVAPSDYQYRSGVLVWDEKDYGPKAIEVPVRVDDINEHEESFRVRLTKVTGALALVREAIIRLVEPGAVDPGFSSPVFDGGIQSIQRTLEGEFLLAGDFQEAGAVAAGGLVRLKADGSIDRTLSVASGLWQVGRKVHRAIADASGRIWLGGDFLQFGSWPLPGLVGLSSAGVVDWEGVGDLDLSGGVHDLAVLPTGSLYAAGGMIRAGSHESPGVVRLFASGQVDTSWASQLGLGSKITAILPLPDHSVIVGGRLVLKEGDAPFTGLMRLRVDGSVAQSIAVLESSGEWATASVHRLALMKDGGVMVVGDFTKIAGRPCRHMARLAPGWTIDDSFLNRLGSGPSRPVSDVAVDDEGHLIVVGSFDQFGGMGRSGVARVRNDGALDDWDPGEALRESTTWSAIKGTAVEIDPEGSVILGVADLFEFEARVFRVAGPLTNRPGVIEFDDVELEADQGAEVSLVVRRHHGDLGSATVRYVVRAVASETGLIHAYPTGRLHWADGDTQPKVVRIAVPTSSQVTAMEVELLEIVGDALLGEHAVVRLAVRPVAPRELWLRRYFGGAGDGGSSVFEGGVDVDEDGVSNLLEYALDRDPKEQVRASGEESLPRVWLGAASPGEEICLLLEADLPQPLRPDVLYEIVAGDGLGVEEVLARYDQSSDRWLAPPSSRAVITLAPHTDAARQIVRVHDDVPVGQVERRFLWLRVSLEN